MSKLSWIVLVSVGLVAGVPELSLGQGIPMPSTSEPQVLETAPLETFGNPEPTPQVPLPELPPFDGVPHPITLVMPTVDGVSGAVTIDTSDPCSCAKLPDTKFCATSAPVGSCGWAGDDGLNTLEDYVARAECRSYSRNSATGCGFLERGFGCSGYPSISSEGPECRKEVTYFPDGEIDRVRCLGNSVFIGCVEVNDNSLHECEPYLQRPAVPPATRPQVLVGSECHWPMSQEQVQFLIASNGRTGFNPKEYLITYCAQRMCRYCSSSYENKRSMNQTFGPLFDGIVGFEYKSCEPKLLNEERILRQPREEMIRPLPPIWSPIPSQ